MLLYIIGFDEYFDRFLKIGISKQHAQALSLLRLQFSRICILFLEKSNIFQWIFFFKAEVNTAYGNADQRRVYTRFFTDIFKNNCLLKAIFNSIQYFWILILFDVVVILLDKLVKISCLYPIQYDNRLLKLLSLHFLLLSVPFYQILTDILNLFQDTIRQLDIFRRVIKYFFTSLFQLQSVLCFEQYITNHLFDALADHVEVESLVQLISAMKDAVDYLIILCGITYFIVDYLGLVHEEIVVDEYVLCAEVKRISSEVIQFVHVYTVYLVTNQLVLPNTVSILLILRQLTYDQHFYPSYLFLSQSSLQFKLRQMVKQSHTSQFVIPFYYFFLPMFIFFLNLSDYVAVKSVAIRPMTYIMKKACESYCQYRIFFLLSFIGSSIIIDQCLDKLFGKICRSYAMFESGVGGPWENILKTSQLLDFPQSLKMTSIYEIPDDLLEVDKAMNIIIHLPLVVLSKALILSALCHMVGGTWWNFCIIHLKLYLIYNYNYKYKHVICFQKRSTLSQSRYIQIIDHFLGGVRTNLALV